MHGYSSQILNLNRDIVAIATLQLTLASFATKASAKILTLTRLLISLTPS